MRPTTSKPAEQRGKEILSLRCWCQRRRDHHRCGTPSKLGQSHDHLFVSQTAA
jgi:hypothetical protein